MVQYYVGWVLRFPDARTYLRTIERVLHKGWRRSACCVTAPLATISSFQAKYAEAAQLCEILQAIRESELGPEHPDVASVVGDRAVLLQMQVGTSSPFPYPEPSCVDDQLCFNLRCSMAEWICPRRHAERPQGKYAGGVQLWERAVSIRQTKLGDDHPDTVIAQKNLENALNQVRRLHITLGSPDR